MPATYIVYGELQFWKMTRYDCIIHYTTFACTRSDAPARHPHPQHLNPPWAWIRRMESDWRHPAIGAL